MVLHADVKGNRTVEDLRNNVSSIAIETIFNRRKLTRTVPDEDQHDSYLHAPNEELRNIFRSDGLVNMNSFPITERCLTRIVFEDFGWPIKFFRNLGELVRTLDGALKGVLRCNVVVASPLSDHCLRISGITRQRHCPPRHQLL